MTWIGVVDCNNFFVSCERLFRPDLVSKPVAVLSSNDGCIVARSQEVKDMGIPMGVPYFKVKDIIKDNSVTLFSSHFTLYRDLSRRVFATLTELLDEVEQYSIDEAFFTIPLRQDPQLMAERIKTELETKIGIPVSIGIGASKTQAKCAVEVAKKTTGVSVMDKATWQEYATQLSPGDLWGVGGRLSLRYEQAGYRSVAEIMTATPSRIKALFGITGQRLLAELCGRPAYPVNPQLNNEKQSMMSSRSFREATTDYATLEDAIVYHARHIATALRRAGRLARTVRISIKACKYSDFLLQGASLEAVLDRPTNNTFRLLEVAQELLRQAYKKEVPYKKVGVSVAQLVSVEEGQMTLFADSATHQDSILEIMDSLNTKADCELVRIGDRNLSSKWQSRQDRISPAYTTKWTDVAVAKA